MKREDLAKASELQRDDLLVDTFDEYGWVGTRTATDADLAALGYVRLDVDVALLRAGWAAYTHGDFQAATVAWAPLMGQLIDDGEGEA